LNFSFNAYVIAKKKKIGWHTRIRTRDLRITVSAILPLLQPPTHELFIAAHSSKIYYDGFRLFRAYKGFTLKTHQVFSVHTAPEKFENATTTGHFGFVFEKNSGREIT